MSTTPLFDQPVHRLADTSLSAFAHVRETLSEREIEVFLRVCDYVALTGYPDVTGGELAAWAEMPLVSCRPRLTGLVDKGWLLKGPARKSRAAGESRSHGVFPALPREAVENRAKVGARTMR